MQFPEIEDLKRHAKYLQASLDQMHIHSASLCETLCREREEAKQVLYYRDRYKMLMDSASAMADYRMHRIFELEDKLAKLNGPKCLNAECEDYDGEHPYHENVAVKAHEAGQQQQRLNLRNAVDRGNELALENETLYQEIAALKQTIRDLVPNP